MKTNKRYSLVIGIFILALILAACQPKTTEIPTLTIMTHDSFAISADLVKKYEESHNVHLSFIPSGDAGAMLNRAILTKGFSAGRCALRGGQHFSLPCFG